MRINDKDKQMEIESRDINYIMPAYIRSYLFYTKNQLPKRIIFPMFPSVRLGDVNIPIEYLPPIDPVVAEIATDGSNIAEITEAQEAVLDKKDEEIKRLKAELEQLKPTETIGRESEAEEPTVNSKPASKSKAKAAFATSAVPDRKPKLPPGGDIGAGLPLSDTHARDRRDQSRTKADLAEGPDIDEDKEKPYEKEIDRDKQGRPVIKE